MSDTAEVGLSLGGLLVLTIAVAIGLRAAWHATGRAERITLRLIPIGLLLMSAAFVKTSFADVSVALQSLTSVDDEGKTKIELGPTGRDVRISGSLTEGAAAQLANLLDRNPQVGRIHLTSDGGLVDEGDALRRVIATRRLTTFVPDYCVSACTLVFLGGRERLIMSGARLGFHAPFEEGLFGQIFQGDQTGERALYISAGVTPQFTDRALAVASTDIWTPDPDVLMAAHVVTGVVSSYRFPDSNLDGIATPVGARATVLRNFPVAKVLDRWRPEDVDSIAAAYLAAYQDGLSEGEVTDGLKAVVGSAAAAAIIDGDDDTIVRYGRFLDSAMQAAKSDADCATIGAEADLVQAAEALDRGDGLAELSAISLLTRALRAPRGATGLEMPDGMSKISISDKGPIAGCAQIRGLYERALRQPRREAAALIRMLAKGQASLSATLVVHAN